MGPKLVALALLPPDQHPLSRVVGQPHAAHLLDDEVACCKLAAVDEAERQTVGEHGRSSSIKSRARPARPGRSAWRNPTCGSSPCASRAERQSCPSMA